MARVHLFEVEDQDWCPPLVRDATTDLLAFFLRFGNYYAPVIPQLKAALRATGKHDIVDLCSGSGGPWLRLLREFSDDPAFRVTLTDKFPNSLGTQRVAGASGGKIQIADQSVDATRVPAKLDGFRCMFTSLHHFRPDAARAILADAVRKQAGIGVFEFTERSLAGVVALSLAPIAVVLAMPFLRPLRWQALLFTYLIPVIPLVAMFDGLVSCLRTYSPDELRALVEPLRREGYNWEIGQVRSWRSPVPITYLIGYPRK